MNTWVITDTHFGHEKLLEYGRPADYEERIWAGLKKVQENDVLIHLGDFCIGNDDAHHAFFAGATWGVQRVLIRGNHDKKSDQYYYAHGWHAVFNAVTIEKYGHTIHLTHRPMTCIGSKELNIHGHTHGNDHREHEYTRTPQHIEVALEYTDYNPVLLSELVLSRKLEV